MACGRVMKGERNAKSLDFFVSTGSGEALVEFQVSAASFLFARGSTRLSAGRTQ